jgi:hypothetical protein
MDWKECNTRRLVKKITADTELAESLVKSAQKKLETANRIKLDDVTATSKITLFYDSLREILESIAIKNGFKIYNHDCYCAFLKEVIDQEEVAELFDRFRKIRNSINYYGKDIKPKEAEEIIEDMAELINKCKKI